MKNLVLKARNYGLALAVAIATMVPSIASAQGDDPPTNKEKTESAVQAAFDALGLDPIAAVTALIAIVGGTFLAVYFFKFGLRTAWIVYRQYSKGASG